MSKAKATAPAKRPRGFRERRRGDGSLRVWWEPRKDERGLGFAPVELDADRLSWSIKEAEKLNRQVAAARNGEPQKAATSRGARLIANLIESYRGSVHFRETLKPKTRDSYGKLMLVIGEKWGARRAAEFDKASMSTWYETLYYARGPRMAQALLRMMQTLMEHAESLGWRPANSNPCARLRMRTPDPRGRVALPHEIAALLAAADALGLRGARLAILMSLLHGQRQTDVLQARRDAFSLRRYRAPGEARARMRLVWSFVRSKRARIGVMVVHDDALPELRLALAYAGTAERPARPEDAVIRDEATGRPYTEFLFAKRWQAIRAHAAAPEKGNCPSVADLQYRDLRRTFGVLARAAGVSKSDVGDVLGNSLAVNPQLAEVYTPPEFETVSRAISAVRLTPTARKGSKA